MIEAKAAAEDLPRVRTDGLSMLRTLLADRFKLAVHRETKDMPMYALILDRKDGRLGPSIRQTPPECAAFMTNGGRGERPSPREGDLPCGRGQVSAFQIANSSITMSRFADLLSLRVERSVQDRTGLTGSFYLNLQWRAEQGAAADAGAADLPTSIFTALREQLGLKLEPIKGSTDVLVIDHIERPTPD